MKPLVLCLALMLVPSLVFCANPAQADSQDQSRDSTDKIQDNLQSILSSDPLLNGADLQAQVDDQSITLTGTVESYAQHQRALQLVQPYAHTRKIIDKIRTVNSQTRYAGLHRFSLPSVESPAT